jgi:hypothetical protein
MSLAPIQFCGRSFVECLLFPDADESAPQAERTEQGAMGIKQKNAKGWAHLPPEMLG